MELDWYQWAGFVGMALVVWAYFLIQTAKTSYNDWDYLWLNFVGAILLTISLVKHFNLGSFLIEIFWIAITIYGMIKAYKRDGGFKIKSIRK